ncbi:MAG: TaqI-like C-terminal specificity domain-containing protein, partial [Ignavibacteria bacterium]|nr:TaqI-like C-terminal specificity domain-containing protein [Ignavibacteria bacterium]
FFVEAKKPSVNVKDDIHPAYQLRSYAWSAKLSLSILTDFEEFAVYDCRIPPNKKDKASNARIMLLTYDQYIDKWDELENIFSLDAIRKGSFDKYIESNKKKKGTAEVDEVFLEQMEEWRKSLAKNIAIRNSKLSIRELNYSVQKTIDRIIFLRICEDRGIEDYGQLMSLQNGVSVYDRLKQIFYRADEKYNSGLFHFEKERDRIEPPDNLTLDLTVDDKTIKEIVKELYYPESPYEFSVLPADILGQVYEQFLGKVIRLTAGHQAVIDDKPEVKKAGGVYYTPTYIVDYIVNNTIGKLLSVIPSEAKESITQDGLLRRPKGTSRNDILNKVSNLKILDPACGSGSFLLGAYQYLLDWHLKYYLKELETSDKLLKQKQPPVYINDRGIYLLTTSEKKNILLKNIYGVDIDPQAVEVTKLSLMLKVLEGESTQTLNNELKFFRERALPDLSNNIKCGNSLIGPDFYNQTEMNFLDDEEKLRINVFDWHKEFPQVFNSKTSLSLTRRGKESLSRSIGSEVAEHSSGFDVVIGNPPYGYLISEQEQNYFRNEYRYQNYQKDLYLLFLERYSFILKNKGLLGVIISNTWLQSITFKDIRQYLVSRYKWLKVLHLPDKVFKAVVDTNVLIFELQTNEMIFDYEFIVEELKNRIVRTMHRLNMNSISHDGEVINIVMNKTGQDLFNKIIKNSKPLKYYFNVYNGIKPFEKGKGTPPQTEKIMDEKPFVKEGAKPRIDWQPLLRGSLINRYKNLWSEDYWILYGSWLAAPRDSSIFSNPNKIMVRQTGDSIIATFVSNLFYARNNLHIILPKDDSYPFLTVLGIINSRLIDYWYRTVNPEKGEALAEVKKAHVESIPIPSIDCISSNSEISLNIESNVKLLLELNSKISFVKTPTERTAIERQIQATDAQIDQLVYRLYGLTEEEIKIVEAE